MKSKKPIIQDTKSLTTKKNEPKSLSVKEKSEKALTTSPKKELSLQEKTKSETKIKNIKKTSNSTTKTKSTTSSAKSKKTNKNTNNSTQSSRTKTSNKKQLIQDFAAHANEYFDLPYRYNETIVKLLAQTPKRLFVYWDISDKDRENYIATFGKDFFNNTIPFLRIKNETHNYTFDIDINDFANSWYIDINDDNSKYSIELYRRFKEHVSNNSINTAIIDNSIFIVSSNKIDAPNGKVISTTYPRTVQYRNIKTNKVSYKEIAKPTNEFYKIFFKDENYSTKINATSSR